MKSLFLLLIFSMALVSARAADVHVFAAASLTDVMRAIAAKYEPISGALDAASRKDVLRNRLVAVVSKESPLQIKSPVDLTSPDIKHLALADPRSVPAGVYAKAYLEKAGLWEKIEPRVIPTQNVRAALAAVESGNVDAGVVYQTDAKISKKVHVAFVFPDTAGISISYPAAVLHDAAQPEAARKFLTYLEGPEASAIFSSYGFIVASVPHDQ